MGVKEDNFDIARAMKVADGPRVIVGRLKVVSKQTRQDAIARAKTMPWWSKVNHGPRMVQSISGPWWVFYG